MRAVIVAVMLGAPRRRPSHPDCRARPIQIVAPQSDTRALARAVESSFKKDLAALGKDLFDEHTEERRGVAALHVFHGFDGAMQAAFPGWPDDTTAANRLASHLFFSSGTIVALGNREVRREITGAFERLVGVLWPRQKINDVPLEKQITLLKIIAKGVKYCSSDYIDS